LLRPLLAVTFAHSVPFSSSLSSVLRVVILFMVNFSNCSS
jgi:hypothetical protein